MLVQQLLSLTATAQKLYFESKAINRVAIGKNYAYKFSAKDSSGQAITYTCDNLPSWIHFDKTNNTLSGIAKRTGQNAIQLNAATKDPVVKQNF